MLNKLLGFIQALVYSLLLTFSVVIFWLNLRYTTHTDLVTFQERVTIVPRGIVPTLLLSLLLMSVAFLLYKALTRLSRTVIFVILTLTVLLSLGIGTVLARYNPYPPNYDQRIVWDMAGYLAGYNDNITYSYIPNYWIKYPQQKTISVILSFFIRLTRNGSPYYFRLFNALAIALYVSGCFILTRKVLKNNAAALLAAVMTALFLPLYFYVNYVYSTVITMTAVLWGFVCFIVSQDKEDVLHSILLPIAGSFLLFFSNLFYKATLIATVATVLYLLFCAAEKRFSLPKKRMAGMVLAASIIVLLPAPVKAYADHVFETRIEVEPNDGFPMTGWILMGIQSEYGVNGPGSYDSSTDFIFADHDYNTAETAADINQQIKETLREYLLGKRSLTFFRDKTIIQWCDPWFSSATMTFFPAEIEESDQTFLYDFLISDGILTQEEILFSYFIPFVSLSVAIAAFLLFHDRKKAGLALTLPAMYFIGGFIFQFFWESKSRYCLPYFLILIPFAAFGAAESAALLHRMKSFIRKGAPKDA